MDMSHVLLRQQQRSARKFHCDLLAHVETAMRCYLRGLPEGTYEALRDCQRALEERITAEGAQASVHGSKEAV